MRLLPDDDEREFASMLRACLSAGHGVDRHCGARWPTQACSGSTLPEEHGGSADG